MSLSIPLPDGGEVVDAVLDGPDAVREAAANEVVAVLFNIVTSEFDEFSLFRNPTPSPIPRAIAMRIRQNMMMATARQRDFDDRSRTQEISEP